MQKLISKYGLAAHLAFVAVAPLFLPTVAVLWLSLLAVAWLVMEPSRIGGEMLHEARRRVSKAIVHDPVFWVSVALVAVAVLRTLNVGVGMTYDAETGKWAMAEPAFPLLPGSVEGCGLPLVGCAVALLVVLQGCRHCLGRSARWAFALVASTLVGADAITETICADAGAALPVLQGVPLVTDPTYRGVAYGVFLVCAIAALAAAFERSWWKVMPFSIVGIGGNLLGLFRWSPPAVIVAHAAVAFVIFAYSFVYLRLRVAEATEFKFLVFVGMGVTLFVLAVQMLCPALFSEEQLQPYLSGMFVPEGYLETRSALSDVSARIWKSSPWLGYGYGSFSQAFQYSATAADWQVVTPLQKAVPNGYWMVLVERGVVGAFFLAAPLALLAVTYVRRLVSGVTLTLPHPLAWAGLLLALVAALETVVDASYLAPGAAVALVSVFSLSAAAFPKEMRSHG